MYPTGMLQNTATGRFHPISFRPAPMPGGSDLPRYRSIGHHTLGFDDVEAARAWIKTTPEFVYDPEALWPWDGDGVPAMTIMFQNGKILS